MQRSRRFPEVRISEVRNKPITTYDREITPIEGVFQVSWPGGVFLWQRPVAVEIQQGDVVRRLPIRDVTRRATISIRLVGLAIGVLAASWMRLKKAGRRRLS
jgi:hypothetical protein